MTLGSVYAAEQHYDDARAQFEAAFALNPKDASPLFQIATTYAQARQHSDGACRRSPRSGDRSAQHSGAGLQGRPLCAAARRRARDRGVRRRRRGGADRRQKVAIMIRKAGYFVQEKKDAQGRRDPPADDDAVSEDPGGIRRLRRLLCRRSGSTTKPITQWQAALGARSEQLGRVAGTRRSCDASAAGLNDSISYLRHYTQVSPDAQGFALLGQAYSRVHDYSGARDACGKSFEIQRSPDNAELRRRCRLRAERTIRKRRRSSMSSIGPRKASSTTIRSCSTSPQNRTPVRTNARRRSRPTSGCCR